MLKMGVIGYGLRIQGVIDLIHKFKAGTQVVAITDVRNEELQRNMKAKGKDLSQIHFYTDANDMLDREELHGVLIGTRCSLHARMAINVLRRNIPLYLEKPVATTMEDWQSLYAAARAAKGQAVVSFPLRLTPPVLQAKDMIESGVIGAVAHVQAWCNVPYGHGYYRAWYRDENETGGLFLQKATHDFDYVTYILGLKPRRVAAMTSKQVFKGAMPAGQKCSECPIPEECPESAFNAFYLRGETSDVKPDASQCAFATDTGNEDSGSALIEYENGMHVSYSQSFLCRNTAGLRGARFMGYKGTIEFDRYTNELKVFFYHRVPKSAVYTFEKTELGHGGGDMVLARNFIQVMQGEAESLSPLGAGLRSALMCLKARESADTHTFQDIPDLPGLELDHRKLPDKLYQHAIFKGIA